MAEQIIKSLAGDVKKRDYVSVTLTIISLLMLSWQGTSVAMVRDTITSFNPYTSNARVKVNFPMTIDIYDWDTSRPHDKYKLSGSIDYNVNLVMLKFHWFNYTRFMEFESIVGAASAQISVAYIPNITVTGYTVDIGVLSGFTQDSDMAVVRIIYEPWLEEELTENIAPGVIDINRIRFNVISFNSTHYTCEVEVEWSTYGVSDKASSYTVLPSGFGNEVTLGEVSNTVAT